MSGDTEIHICLPGQTLNQGRVEYGSMTTKEEAEADAVRRLAADPSIEKIGYYVRTDKGNGSRYFRCLCTKTNSNPVKPRAKGNGGRRGTAGAGGGKPTLLGKIRQVFEED